MTPCSQYPGFRGLMTEQTGFKGAWLCERLALIGAKVGEFALPPEPNRYNPFRELR